MFKVFLLACLLAIASAISYVPAYAPTYYSAVAPQLPLAAVPLAYTRINAPSGSETYNSVATPNSFQQQYRSDYKPLTYSTGLIY